MLFTGSDGLTTRTNGTPATSATGTTSLPGWYGSFLKIVGFIAMVPLVACMKRVAVGCSLGGGGGSNSGPGTGTVLDDECLTQSLLQFLRNRARDQVGAATRSERHEDRDAVRRIILSSRVPRPCGKRDDANHDPSHYDIHRLPSVFVSAAPCGKITQLRIEHYRTA